MLPHDRLAYAPISRRPALKRRTAPGRSSSAMHIRPAAAADDDAIWRIVGPVIAAGETYALPRDWSREDALAF